VSTAVFRPAKEKSRSPLCSSGRGNAKASGRPLGQPRQRRPARIAQAQQLGALVEGLAGGVVDGLAQQLVVPTPSTRINCVWPPDTSSATKGNSGRVGEEGRQQMPLEVVHAQRRLAQRRRQRHRHAGTHQQRAGQPGPRV
jgi:hypothetical protein